MGARNVYHTATGTDARTVFELLQEEARMEKGEDRYNGTISTTSLTGIYECLDYSKKELEKKITSLYDNLDKRDCVCLKTKCLGYEVVTIKKRMVKSSLKPIFKDAWVVYADNGRTETVKDSKVDAEKLATLLALKGDKRVYYVKEKTLAEVDYFAIKNGFSAVEYCSTYKEAQTSLSKMKNSTDFKIISCHGIPKGPSTYIDISVELKKKKPTKIKENQSVLQTYEFIFVGVAPE